jgi:hypothetical protein
MQPATYKSTRRDFFEVQNWYFHALVVPYILDVYISIRSENYNDVKQEKVRTVFVKY